MLTQEVMDQMYIFAVKAKQEAPVVSAALIVIRDAIKHERMGELADLLVAFNNAGESSIDVLFDTLRMTAHKRNQPKMRQQDTPDLFKAPFGLIFDYDAEGEPPHEYITDASGGMCMEVLEDPKPLVENPDLDDDHWQIGANGWLLLELLNAHWSRR